jgi:hypothetical protein
VKTRSVVVAACVVVTVCVVVAVGAVVAACVVVAAVVAVCVVTVVDTVVDVGPDVESVVVEMPQDTRMVAKNRMIAIAVVFRSMGFTSLTPV